MPYILEAHIDPPTPVRGCRLRSLHSSTFPRHRKSVRVPSVTWYSCRAGRIRPVLSASAWTSPTTRPRDACPCSRGKFRCRWIRGSRARAQTGCARGRREGQEGGGGRRTSVRSPERSRRRTRLLSARERGRVVAGAGGGWLAILHRREKAEEGSKRKRTSPPWARWVWSMLLARISWSRARLSAEVLRDGEISYNRYNCTKIYTKQLRDIWKFWKKYFKITLRRNLNCPDFLAVPTF